MLNAKFFKIFYGDALTQQQKVKEKQRSNILLSLHACTAQNGSKLCQKAIKDKLSRARLVHVFKNWKLLFENICENTCGWKSVLKCVKCCLKTKNGFLKS